MIDFLWPVVPVCDRQRRDVRKEDLLVDGLFRRCHVGRAGAGYDKFPVIAEHRGYGVRLDKQFIVQLYGCPLQCDYCYVTQDGVTGDAVRVSTRTLTDTFLTSDCRVFHLMGGAPAFYLSHWRELTCALPSAAVFHSDFLLIEGHYEDDALLGMPGLHAVNFKSNAVYQASNVNYDLMWRNFDRLVACKVDFYVTFTDVPEAEKMHIVDRITENYGMRFLRDAFDILIRRYKALED